MSKVKCDALGRRIPDRATADNVQWQCECPMPNCPHWSSASHVEDAIVNLMLHLRTHPFKVKRAK